MLESNAETDEKPITHTNRCNEDAFRPRTLDYPKLRPRIIRRHNKVYHSFPNETPAMTIPADMDVVVL